MSEVVSEDTMAWARDLALIRKLLAGELNPSPAEGAVGRHGACLTRETHGGTSSAVLRSRRRVDLTGVASAQQARHTVGIVGGLRKVFSFPLTMEAS